MTTVSPGCIQLSISNVISKLGQSPHETFSALFMLSVYPTLYSRIGSMSNIIERRLEHTEHFGQRASDIVHLIICSNLNAV